MTFYPRHAARTHPAHHPAGAVPLCPFSRCAAEPECVSRPIALVNGSAPVNAMLSREKTLFGSFIGLVKIREPLQKGRPAAGHLHSQPSVPAAAGVGSRLRPRCLRHAHGRVRSVQGFRRSFGAAARPRGLAPNLRRRCPESKYRLAAVAIARRYGLANVAPRRRHAASSGGNPKRNWCGCSAKRRTKMPARAN